MKKLFAILSIVALSGSIYAGCGVKVPVSGELSAYDAEKKVLKVGSEEISNQIMSPFSPSQTSPGGSWINNDIQIFTSLFFQIMFKIFPQLVCFVFYRGKL
jgi:hypothetical protein